MNKPLFIISAPMDTYSGYGARSRDIIKAIIATDKFDVKLLSQRWGNTRFGYLADHNEDIMQSLIIPKVDAKPEYWMQITVPNEFQKVGTYNIGCTAGMETTQVAPEWLQGVPRVTRARVQRAAQARARERPRPRFGKRHDCHACCSARGGLYPARASNNSYMFCVYARHACPPFPMARPLD